MIHFLCVGCKRALKANDGDAGKKCKCKCGENNVIPGTIVQKTIPKIELSKNEPLPIKAEILPSPPRKEELTPASAPDPVVVLQPIQPRTQNTENKSSFFPGGLGRTLLVLGIVGAAYFLLMFDTTVGVDREAAALLGTKRRAGRKWYEFDNPRNPWGNTKEDEQRFNLGKAEAKDKEVKKRGDLGIAGPASFTQAAELLRSIQLSAMSNSELDAKIEAEKKKNDMVFLEAAHATIKLEKKQSPVTS